MADPARIYATSRMRVPPLLLSVGSGGRFIRDQGRLEQRFEATDEREATVLIVPQRNAVKLP
jgi:hypothetical protein